MALLRNTYQRRLLCLDLNTLQLVWVQDVLDDSNSTPVLSVEDGHLYLYVSTSFRLGWRSSTTAEVPVWKIDAETGEIIWQTSYDCSSEDSVSGGVQSTIAVGKEELSDNIYVTVARTGGQAQGVLACIDKNTGKVNWEHESAYAWSSPVCVYNPDGSGKVLYCNSTGHIYWMEKQEMFLTATRSVRESSKHLLLYIKVIWLWEPEIVKYGGWNCSDAVPPPILFMR